MIVGVGNLSFVWGSERGLKKEPPLREEFGEETAQHGSTGACVGKNSVEERGGHHRGLHNFALDSAFWDESRELVSAGGFPQGVNVSK